MTPHPSLPPSLPPSLLTIWMSKTWARLKAARRRFKRFLPWKKRREGGREGGKMRKRMLFDADAQEVLALEEEGEGGREGGKAEVIRKCDHKEKSNKLFLRFLPPSLPPSLPPFVLFLITTCRPPLLLLTMAMRGVVVGGRV